MQGNYFSIKYVIFSYAVDIVKIFIALFIFIPFTYVIFVRVVQNI